MIEVITNTLKDVLDNLGTVGRIGGLARPVEKHYFDADGEQVSYIFPVSDDVSNLLCSETGRYEDLTPNDAYETVVYFESDGQLQDVSNMYERAELQGSVRVVCWMNYAKLGPSDQTPAVLRNYKARLIRDFVRTLEGTGRRHTVTETGFDGAIVRILGQISTTEDVYSIFSDYDLPQEVTLFPYSAFAIDLDVELITTWDCITSVTDGADWTCIDINNDGTADTVPDAIGDDRNRVIGDPDRGIVIGKPTS